MCAATVAAIESKLLFKDILVVVDFFATWCGPCKMIAPKLESMSKEMAGKVVFLKVNYYF